MSLPFMIPDQYKLAHAYCLLYFISNVGKHFFLVLFKQLRRKIQQWHQKLQKIITGCVCVNCAPNCFTAPACDLHLKISELKLIGRGQAGEVWWYMAKSTQRHRRVDSKQENWNVTCCEHELIMCRLIFINLCDKSNFQLFCITRWFRIENYYDLNVMKSRHSWFWLDTWCSGP